MAQKIYPSGSDALAGLLFDGMTIAAGGFGFYCILETIIGAIRDSGVKDLTVISNHAGDRHPSRGVRARRSQPEIPPDRTRPGVDSARVRAATEAHYEE